jgi:hypothetical protein
MRVHSTHAAAAILGVLTLFSAGFWLIDQTHDGFRPLDPLPQKQLDPHAPRSIRVESRTEYATATGSYPQFEYASVEFNTQIQRIVQKAIEEHFLLSEGNQKAMLETDPEKTEVTLEDFPLSVSFEAPVHDEDLISVIVHIEQYSGGAHGSSSMHTFTYDVGKKRIISLPDLFPGYEKTLYSKISAEARAQLSETLSKQAGGETPDADFLSEGTEPKEENFKLFTISPQRDAVTIYFGLYQVAPYVYGEQQISLPLPQEEAAPAWLQ